MRLTVNLSLYSMGQIRCLTRIAQRIINSSETDNPSIEWKRPFIARISPAHRATHAEYDIILDINLVQSDLPRPSERESRVRSDLNRRNVVNKRYTNTPCS